MYLKKVNPLIKGSVCNLGGFYITSVSDGLKDKAVAGRPSVAKFTHKS